MTNPQTMTQLDVQPNPLERGGKAEITVTGGPASQTITIDVSDGGNPPQTDKVDVQLDADGNGTGEWNVANWDLAIFTYEDSQVTRPIV